MLDEKLKCTSPSRVYFSCPASFLSCSLSLILLSPFPPRGIPTLWHRRWWHDNVRGNASNRAGNLQDDRTNRQTAEWRRYSREGNLSLTTIASFFHRNLTVVTFLSYPFTPFHLTPQRVDKIFRNMDRNKDARLTYEEFVEGSKQDPTIVQVRSSPFSSHTLTRPSAGTNIPVHVSPSYRLCHYTMASCRLNRNSLFVHFWWVRRPASDTWLHRHSGLSFVSFQIAFIAHTIQLMYVDQPTAGGWGACVGLGALWRACFDDQVCMIGITCPQVVLCSRLSSLKLVPPLFFPLFHYSSFTNCKGNPTDVEFPSIFYTCITRCSNNRNSSLAKTGHQ